jgi:hypothetical protein
MRSAVRGFGALSISPVVVIGASAGVDREWDVYTAGVLSECHRGVRLDVPSDLRSVVRRAGPPAAAGLL